MTYEISHVSSKLVRMKAFSLSHLSISLPRFVVKVQADHDHSFPWGS